MIDVKQLDKMFQRQPGSSLLGLSIDGNRLEGVLVRRTNGSVEIKKTFAATLSLDPLTAEIELAGREIRNQLDAQQIRERWCAVCLPLNWALTLTVKLPEIPDEDVTDFLQIEAERGLPYSPEELMLTHSQFSAADGEKFATLVGVPREHMTRLEAVLQAADLRPVTFSLGITALQRADADSTGTLALLAGEHSIGMQITEGGGVANLRTIDGAFEQVGAGQELQVAHVTRELRITLGQLPHEVRDAIKRVRIFGRNEAAQELAEELRSAAESWGLKVEHVREHPAEEFGIKIPSGTAISPALVVAVRKLAGVAGMEFLPPKVSEWKKLTERYSSGKLAYAGMGAGAIALMVALAFLVQQIILWHWQSKWARMDKGVTELTEIRDQIRQYRPWYDNSVRTLSILRRLTEAFPEDGVCSVKTLELRDSSIVTCTGTALTREAFLKARDEFAKAKEVSNVHVENTRGNTPMEFTFNFQWGGGVVQ